MADRAAARLGGVLALLGALAAVPPALGCGLALDTPLRGPRNTCAVDDDCTDARCDAARGICVVDPIEPYDYSVQLELPASERDARPALTAIVGPYIASTGDATSEVLAPLPVDVVGTVRLAGDPATAVEADVSFTARSAGPTPPIPPIVVRAAGAGVAPADAPTDFATQLVPGTYDVEVRPRSQDVARYAPLRASLELMVGQRFDVEMRPTREHFVLRGIVVDASGAGQDGLEVRAIDPAGRLVSSVATTRPSEGGEDGWFELFVDPAVEVWSLRVSAPAAVQEGGAFPTITIDPAVLAYEGMDPERHVRILVPSSDDNSVCFAGTVELPAERGGGPVVGATVTLRSRSIADSVTRLVGSYSIQVTSRGAADEAPLGCSRMPLPEGGFEARLVPGVYDVEIRALDPELGVYVATEPLMILDETYGHAFEMPARPRLAGVVQRSEDEPVIDARVRAVPLAMPLPLAGARASLLNRPGETITDPQGNFRLPLDVGVYDLVAEPPEGSGFPWVVRPAFAMAAREWTEVLDVRYPVAVRGRAIFDDGTPIGGAQITAYVVAGDPGAQRAVTIGRAIAQSDGTFLLLLPPEI